MAKYELVERDGRLVRVYESGLERDDASGRILKPAAGTLITRENSTYYHRRRQEKTQRLLRQRLTEAAAAVLPAAVRNSPEAFAEAAAMLFEQVVLNSEAYPRDRLEAWEKLGKYAGVLPADVRQADADAPGAAAAALNAAAAANVQTARVLARVFGDVMRAQLELQKAAAPAAAADQPPALPEPPGE